LLIGAKSSKNLLGRVWINLEPRLKKFVVSETSEKVEFFFRKPKWYNIIYDATGQKCG
jgi:hypothetical protein